MGTGSNYRDLGQVWGINPVARFWVEFGKVPG